MAHYWQEISALTMRWVRRLSREKFSMLFTLVQPMLFWLIFFGNLFQRAADTQVTQAPNYISFLAAGVVVHVTQGTVATDPKDLLRPALEALADLDGLVVATTPEPSASASTMRCDVSTLPATTATTDSLPGTRQMARSMASMDFNATPVWNSTSPMRMKKGIGVSEKLVIETTPLRTSWARPASFPR